MLTSEPTFRYVWIGVLKWPKQFGSSQMQTELIQSFFKERCSLGKGGQTEAGPGSRDPSPSQGMTASKQPNPSSLLFSRRSWFHWPAKWPAGQKSGHLVQAPVHQDHPSSDEEVLERPGSWVRFWCWTPLTGLLSITTLCPVLTPNTLPGELLWLWVEPLSHQAGCHYCTHWQQSPAAALPALSLLPSHFYLWKVKFASTESTGLDGKQG